MANTQAMCTSFKQELLTGTHVIGTDVIKIALFNANAAGLSAATTAYATTINSATEVSNSGTYTAGGSTITMQAPAISGTTAYTGPASASTVSWTGFSATNFDCALVYNSSKTNKAISVHTFSAQTITAGTFTITFPTNAAGTALLNFA
jgi:hypothetical protein